MAMAEDDDEARSRSLNSFQIISGILAAAFGIRGRKDRGLDITQASNAALIGAVVIFVTVMYLGMRLFVYLIQRSVAS
jgi:hypothetical protein